MADTQEPQPGPLKYVVSFTLVGIAWGLTTPFIRRAAKDHHPAPHPVLESDAVRSSWLKSKVYGAFFAVVDLLRNPRYAVPLLLNLTGSVWFFLLIGKAELSLTVPIVNTLAFLFTVIGDWWVDGKVISRNTMAGQSGVASVATVKVFFRDKQLPRIALCVHSKNK